VVVVVGLTPTNAVKRVRAKTLVAKCAITATADDATATRLGVTIVAALRTRWWCWRWCRISSRGCCRESCRLHRWFWRRMYSRKCRRNRCWISGRGRRGRCRWSGGGRHRRRVRRIARWRHGWAGSNLLASDWLGLATSAARSAIITRRTTAARGITEHVTCVASGSTTCGILISRAWGSRWSVSWKGRWCSCWSWSWFLRRHDCGCGCGRIRRVCGGSNCRLISGFWCRKRCGGVRWHWSARCASLALSAAVARAAAACK
jgi:hypothetical protein